MISTPKVIGLMSCGFLLCLGLSNPAQAVAADGTSERQPGGPRVGGQSGVGGEPAMGSVGKAGKHGRKPGGPRVGGQAGKSAGTHTQEGEVGKPHARQPGGPRAGGQGGQ
jgi:hypothetical protein